ncbi:tetratricopeptide repeat protein [Rhodanobacter sp. KK11]|jgi:tetratricopeptide (TPR) repeat protein|uniref:tetratricopeptide repeat protein n=1 Tax=Rhodanobacter sp. KK11 TaxID=3083255 RepID=UPI0029666B4F|nr:tetratricopeptide repeat protein [Rhodanobacter sp. KK11]MDW2983213.1 tetratricopeptide repeat protein [Rhodanobacter sp. KK11]
MPYPSKRSFQAPLLLATVLLAGCGMFATTPPPASPPPLPAYDQVAAIRAAGEREKSVIAVNPLRDPGIAALQDAAKRDEQAGKFADAAATLDQALKLSPDSPDLLQERAEVAVRLKDFSAAEKLAHRSWSLGPRLGPLCARNWQTVVEARLQARDQEGADTARKWVAQCHKPGIPRY